ncbi:MAG: hypothetical protein Greene07147_796 [Parcubacteria group bacterium Greene0714_7]|nr:MAG: hypothetical protein Greene07147_796 [Parcubacteria group bacterium Greene0714_7]
MDALENVRALAFDLDGTLTESKCEMTPEMGEALAHLLVRLPVGIMSGGSYTQFQKQVVPFLPVGSHLERLHLFPTSAARCYAYKENEWRLVYSHDFTPDEKQEIMAALNAGIAKTHIVDDSTPTFGERTEDRGAQISFSALGQNAPIELKRAWDPTQEKRMPLQKLLVEALPNFSVRINASNTIDITRAGITKAYGIQRFSEMVGIPMGEMLYVGDALFEGGNDAVVKEAGIPTQSVSNPEETLALIRQFLTL